MAVLKVIVGIDWAKHAHQVCVVDANGRVIRERKVKHEAVALAELCDELDKLSPDKERIGIAIETPHGILVETLMERGFRVFVINPKQLDRFRDRFAMSGAKDDRRDARVLADSLRTDSRAFRELQRDDSQVVQIREFSRIHDELTSECSRLSNQVREQLHRYYPQFLAMSGTELERDWILVTLKAVPSPSAAREMSETDFVKLLQKRRVRRLKAKSMLAILQQREMTVSDATVRAASAHVSFLVERLEVARAQLKSCDKQLKLLLAEFATRESGEGGEHSAVTIALSCPGIGHQVIGTMLAEAPRALIAGDHQALRTLAGVAPVTKRSGRSCVVTRRYAHNHRLGNMVYNWARVAIQHDPRSTASYAALRARGHGHARALRGVADRSLQMLCAMIKSRTIYDPSRRTCAA